MGNTDCKLCLALTRLNKEDRTELVRVITKGTVTKTDIASVMTRNGYPMSEASVRRHLTNHRTK
jgi:hypothetical protein